MQPKINQSMLNKWFSAFKLGLYLYKQIARLVFNPTPVASHEQVLIYDLLTRIRPQLLFDMKERWFNKLTEKQRAFQIVT